MFKKVASSEHVRKMSPKSDNYAKIYNHQPHIKGRGSMGLIICTELATRANMRVGERASVHLVEDDANKKWLLIERDPNGSKLTSMNNSKEDALKKPQRFKVQVRVMDWMKRHVVGMGEEARRLSTNLAKTQDGGIAFPLEAKKEEPWFKRG